MQLPELRRSERRSYLNDAVVNAAYIGFYIRYIGHTGSYAANDGLMFNDKHEARSFYK